MVWAQLGPHCHIYSKIVSVELIFSCIESVSKDLESFAKHAGRTQISVDDVMLLARRNEGLEALLRAYVEKSRKESGNGPARGGRR
jgi:CENP-S protein